ncbi:hypothetical protein [Haemophilus sp. SZY H52]|uniref:hypothetical protein n=1 Tax=Haemophilus sp. SZY H52 TaxID=3042471 RepID=UPI003518348C
MSNIIIESLHSKIPFTIDVLFEHTIIIFAFAYVSVTGSIFLSKYIGEIIKNIKEFLCKRKQG